MSTYIQHISNAYHSLQGITQLYFVLGLIVFYGVVIAFICAFIWGISHEIVISHLDKFLKKEFGLDCFQISKQLKMTDYLFKKNKELENQLNDKKSINENE